MKEVDYIIVGAGSAGCVLANRLSADGHATVLLLEAGGEDSHPLVRMPAGFLKALQKRSLTWGFESEPEEHLNGRRLPVPRGRLLGGSSSINGMFHIRGHRRDFDDWRDLGCAGWGYDDVLPYFKRSETHWRGAGHFHGGQGPLQVRHIDTRLLLEEPLREAARQAGHAVVDDYDAEDGEGIARGDVAIDARGRRSSTSRAYLHPVRHRGNLQVRTRAEATRVLVEQGRAVGVEFRHAGQLQQARARREVVLCGGSYNSPQLLMLSGIGPAEHLRAMGIEPRADRKGVGANLIEHPRMMLMYRANAPVTFIRHLRFDRAVVSALQWGLLGKGPFATQICSGTVLLKTRPELDRPDIQLLCNPARFDAGLWFPGLVKPKEHSFYITVCLLNARSRGRVSLRSADPQVAPKIAFNLFSEPEDFRTLRAGLRAARDIYRMPPQAALIDAETIPGAHVRSDEEIDQAIRTFGGITHHPVGTCAMGIGPDAVVDPQLRVIGVAGLRVVDASIMPTIPAGNTNAATVMIAEKAADLILGINAPAGAFPATSPPVPTRAGARDASAPLSAVSTLH